MKKLSIISILIALIAGGAFAFSQYNRIQEENALAEKKATEIAQLEKLSEDGDYIELLSAINALEEPYEETEALRVEATENLEASVIDDAWELIYQYDYTGASELLTEANTHITAPSDEFTKLLETCEDFSNPVPYTGTIEHIFYHPLIAYTDEAFDGDYMERGFADYFVTVDEFKIITERLYENDYILIDIRLIYEKQEDGTVKKSELLLPEGKKPLVLSIDDLNFYEYMKGNGMAHGFEIDENGDIMTYTDNENGERSYSYDNAIVPILENYKKTMPGFFWGGHCGTLALTGYEGALGFPTDIMDAPDYPEVLEEAKAVADKLKTIGWNYACHSYGHNSPSKRTYEQMVEDTDKWLRELTPVIGETDLYIYPFGELIDFDDPKHTQMVDKGFTMFCGVEAKPYMRFYDTFVLQQRRNVDGIAFEKDRLSNMIDTDGILDPERPIFND